MIGSPLRGLLLSRATLIVVVAHSVLSADDRTFRIATFNIQELRLEKLSTVDQAGRGNHPQLQAAAWILQRIRPDIVLINEIDYTGTEEGHESIPPERDAPALFLERYLSIPQAATLQPLDYPFRFYAPVNTGVPSHLDFNQNGRSDDPNDAFGYGTYPGEYGMLLWSRFPIENSGVRTFRKFLWKEMPDNLMPDGTAGKPSFYSPEVVAVFRLSSKSHWDVPVLIHGAPLHLLCSHPTPPIFDGPEDANGRRNHDEIRFWRDYLSAGPSADWIRDDVGTEGGLSPKALFVLLGDLNSDPVRSDSDYGQRPIDLLLSHPRVADPKPTSLGALEGDFPRLFESHRKFRTHRFGRLDYLLPSLELRIVGGGVFWPASEAADHDVAVRASDHRLVWIDLQLP